MANYWFLSVPVFKHFRVYFFLACPENVSVIYFSFFPFVQAMNYVSTLYFGLSGPEILFFSNAKMGDKTIYP